MLGAKGGSDPRVACCCERVQRVDQVPCDRRWMREQRDTSPCERSAQLWFVEESINAKLHIYSSNAKLSEWWKSGLPWLWRPAQ